MKEAALHAMLQDELDLIRDFLIESNENLARVEREMVELEANPADLQLIGSIFRSIHTIKGTCGFFDFGKLEKITHSAENILSQLRDGERPLTPKLATLLLETIDAVKQELAAIEGTGAETAESRVDLLNLLKAACETPAEGTEILAAETAAEMAVPPEAADAHPNPAPQPVEAAAGAGPARPAQDAGEPAGKHGLADSSIRVDIAVLENLMNLAGELVLVRNQIVQAKGKTEAEKANSVAIQRLNTLTHELQEGVMKTRMQPASTVFSKMPRVVRDMANSLRKQIRVVTEGADTEMDRGILEAIKDPLTHMVRNSCDHGIETPEVRLAAGKPAAGTLSLKAYHEGGRVVVEIADDGAGIDPERLKRKALEKGLLSAEQAAGMSARECFRLIFFAGFSTAAAVTNISGRGVGMDVVQRNIERIGGTVDIQSTVGEGTCFKIHIPLTLAIIPALAVFSAGQQFLIPQLNVARLVRLPQADGTKVEWLNETPVFRYRGKLVPLVCLDELLRLRSSRQIPEPVNIVVLHSDQGTLGLVVDKVVAMREIVVKPFGRELGQLPAYAGATILGDGKVALILDVAGLTRLAGCMGEQQDEESGSGRVSQTAQQTMLLFSCGGENRLGVPLSLIERLERFDRSQIEWSSGAPVIQYRGRILPLASLEKVLDSSHEGSCFQLANLPVIVINQEMRRIGLAVDQIIDIQTGELSARGMVTNPKLLCSAVFGGKVVDVLNLPEVLQAADPTWFRRRSQERQTGKRIVVAMPVRFHRSVVRHTLELAGHEAIEAATTDEAIQAIRQKEPHAVLCSLDLPEGGLGGLALQLPGQIAAGLPLIGLSPEPDALASAQANNLGAASYVGSFDYKNILRAIDTLLGPKRPNAMTAQQQNEHSGGVEK